jgi:hypothetical protein
MLDGGGGSGGGVCVCVCVCVCVHDLFGWEESIALKNTIRVEGMSQVAEPLPSKPKAEFNPQHSQKNIQTPSNRLSESI